jgi:hypothetical protein
MLSMCRADVYSVSAYLTLTIFPLLIFLSFCVSVLDNFEE